jgi:hypothetical protein
MKLIVNAPPVVVVVLCEMLSMVTVTVSPTAGYNEPELTIPPSVIGVAPTVIDCDAVTELNVAVALLTVSAVLVFVAVLKFGSPA